MSINLAYEAVVLQFPFHEELDSRDRLLDRDIFQDILPRKPRHESGADPEILLLNRNRERQELLLSRL